MPLISGHQRLKMDAAARVIQASWKYYQLRQRCNSHKPFLAQLGKQVLYNLFDINSLSLFEKGSFSRRSSIGHHIGHSLMHVSRKSCEEMFQTSLMRWRKVRSEIEHLQAKNAAAFGHCHVVTNDTTSKSKSSSRSASPNVSTLARTKWSMLRSKYENNGQTAFESPETKIKEETVSLVTYQK